MLLKFWRLRRFNNGDAVSIMTTLRSNCWSVEGARKAGRTTINDLKTFRDPARWVKLKVRHGMEASDTSPTYL
jgi:hypothetical protein